MVTTSIRVLATVTLLVGMSCGGAAEQTEPTTPDPGTAGAGDATTDPEPAATTGWEAMDREARLAVMREQVVPELGEMFRTFDSDEFSTFGCATCHGENMAEVDFHMPNTLHPLVPAEIPTFLESEDEEIRTYAEFMINDVAPNMVRILGVQPFDPATGEGFGCMSCHATAEAPAAE